MPNDVESLVAKLKTSLNEVENDDWFPIYLDESVSEQPVWQIWTSSSWETVADVYSKMPEKLANYMALCNPINVKCILDYIESLEAEVENNHEYIWNLHDYS